MPLTSRDRHLFDPGPKRILALDGGGVRGIIALAFLERLETILQARASRDIRLADYFDLIGGTSTGAIIASCLSVGMRVGELIDLYVTLAQECFRGSRWHGGLLLPKFRSAPLLGQLRLNLGDTILGSDRLLTGLAIVAKRIDTGSVWVFHNNPRGPFFDPDGQTSGTGNKDLPLINLVRASTAAPTFFAPEHIVVAPGVSGTFVDGGVSPHNNPALLMLLLATLNGYGFRWATGSDRLMLLSVGTGHRPFTRAMMPSRGAPAVNLAVLAVRSVMDDCSALGQTLLQWLGQSPTPWPIDSEVGDLRSDQLGGRAYLHYQRYDVQFVPSWLAATLGEHISEAELERLQQFDRPDHVARLLDLGRRAAAIQVQADHLPDVFDLLPVDTTPDQARD